MAKTTYQQVQEIQGVATDLGRLVTKAKTGYISGSLVRDNNALYVYAVMGGLYHLKSLVEKTPTVTTKTWKRIDTRYFLDGVAHLGIPEQAITGLEELLVDLMDELNALADSIAAAGDGGGMVDVSASPSNKVISFMNLKEIAAVSLDTDYVGIFETYNHDLTEQLYAELIAQEKRSFGPPGEQVMFCQALYGGQGTGFVCLSAVGDGLKIYDAMCALSERFVDRLAFIGLWPTKTFLRNSRRYLGLDILESQYTVFKNDDTLSIKKATTDAMRRLLTDFGSSAGMRMPPRSVQERIERVCTLGHISSYDLELYRVCLFNIVKYLELDNIPEAFDTLYHALGRDLDSTGFLTLPGLFFLARVLAHYVLYDALMAGSSNRKPRNGVGLLNLG